MKITHTDTVKPALALRRRSIRVLTTDELRNVHGGNTSAAPTANTTNVQTGTISSGTSVISRAQSNVSTVIRPGAVANPSGGKV
jgi:hypothetical protein